MRLIELQKTIKKQANAKKAKNCLWFFKTGKGEYGEGDKFLGISNPKIHQIVKDFFGDLNLNDLGKLIQSKFHEERLIALLILVLKFQKGNLINKKDVYNFYLKHTKYINNWDLVDLSAYKIVGAYLFDKNRNVLYKLTKSQSLWERRISIISTFYFIQKKDVKDALAIAEILVNDKHDLIQKAVGWMLREIGKRSGEAVEERFLKKHYKTMPRTALRYAIERFPESKRQFYIGR
jgi:3-methyladenine DNA glycosylase AlkD